MVNFRLLKTAIIDQITIAQSVYNQGVANPVDMVEGPEAFKRFEAAMKKVVAVPRAVVQQRIEEQRKQAQANPNKRGPKKKG